MPVTGNVSFGGQQFPTFYGPNARMTQMLYQPQGSTAAGGDYGGNPWAGAAQASLPYINAWANMPQGTQTPNFSGVQGPYWTPPGGSF